MEVRTVPADEDGEEDTAETWYIYTIRYNGEAYFADTIFALTDEQKGLAENYAENLSLFLGDGLFQYAPFTNTITALGDVRFTDGATDVVYFNQLDERYANQPYGTDHIGAVSYTHLIPVRSSKSLLTTKQQTLAFPSPNGVTHRSWLVSPCAMT